MAELKDYLFKPIKTDKISLISSLRDNFILVYHSLLPHSFPVEPKSKITTESINDDDVDLVYESSLEIYKSSKERIKSLESKAFNLMTYISAITAILFFLLNKDLDFVSKILVIASILILMLALLISLRCIGIKTQKDLFIDSMFDFKAKKIISTKKKHICTELINNTLFNQNVADNTTDILKASRILLFYGIILSSASFLSYFISDKEVIKANQMELVNSKYIDSIYSNYKTFNKSEFIKLNEKINSLEIELDIIKSDTIHKEKIK